MPKQAQRSLKLSELVTLIRNDYPDLSLVEAPQFSWHAGHNVVSFKSSCPGGQKDTWALLHELGHALLSHSAYHYDFELLKLEAAAWAKSHEIALKYGIDIDDDYVQDCLDTYRDWLHLRATCPKCLTRSLQITPERYSCFNCQAEWSVSRNRFCRPYRLQKVEAL